MDDDLEDADNITKLKASTTLHLDIHDNHLFLLVTKRNYDIIINLIHNKYTQICILLSWIVWFALVATQITALWSIYIILISLFFWMPYCFGWLLSVNRTAFRFILKSFDFWIKTVYMIIWGVFEMIHRFILQKNRFDQPALVFFAYLFFDIVAVLGLIIISSFDGFPTKHFWTILISAFVSIVTLLYSLFFQFERASVGDDSIVIFYDEYQLSLRTFIINAQRVVGIFLAKQTIAIIRSRDKATSINIKPKLVWRETIGDDREDNMDDDIHQNNNNQNHHNLNIYGGDDDDDGLKHVQTTLYKRNSDNIEDDDDDNNNNDGSDGNVDNEDNEDNDNNNNNQHIV